MHEHNQQLRGRETWSLTTSRHHTHDHRRDPRSEATIENHSRPDIGTTQGTTIKLIKRVESMLMSKNNRR